MPFVNAELAKEFMGAVLFVAAVICLIFTARSARFDGEDAAKAKKPASPRDYSQRTAWLRYGAFAASVLSYVLTGKYVVLWLGGDPMELFDWSMLLIALAVFGPIPVHRRGYSLYTGMD
jgi:hypothetical protein